MRSPRDLADDRKEQITMKIATYLYVKADNPDSQSTLLNLGDFFQGEVVANLIRNNITGIEQEIKAEEMRTYQGEQLIVPLQASIFNKMFMIGDKISISSDIKPIFLATVTGSNYKESYMNEHNIEYLQSIEPIGCRDQSTYELLTENGIDCYLTGCLTATIPRRKVSETQTEVLFVDVPEGLRQYVPKHILEEAKYFEQQCYVDKYMDISQIKSKIFRRYEYYKNNAKLIVTSRLHVALPAIAMGIPVIFAKTVIDSRFTFFEKYTKLYSENEFNEINWEPQVIEYENLKSDLVDSIIQRITSGKTQLHTELTDYFQGTTQIKNCILSSALLNETYNTALRYLSDKYGSEDRFLYTVWGLNKSAEKFLELVNKSFPNAKVQNIVDNFKTGYWQDEKIVTCHEVDFMTLENILVFPVGACNQASVYFPELGVSENRYKLLAEIYMK